MLMEKDDFIEQLKAELEAKRQEIADALLSVADLREELDIMEKKQQALSAERDQLNIDCKEQQYQNSKLQEQIEDKDEKIEELKSKVEILTSGKNFIKNAHEKLLAKQKKLEEENFIIPKKKEESKESEESSEESTQPSTDGDGGLSAILQNELRQLHFKLRQKDQIITEFKKEAQAFYADKV